MTSLGSPSDNFTEMLRHGAAVDSTQLLGSGAPVLRILITANTLDTLNTANTLDTLNTATGRDSRTRHGFPDGHRAYPPGRARHQACRYGSQVLGGAHARGRVSG